MNFSNEQIEKAKNCKTLEEFKSLAKAEGLNLSEEEAEKYFNETRTGELNDDELNAVAGGKGWVVKDRKMLHIHCPFCGALNYIEVTDYLSTEGRYRYEWSPNACTCGAKYYDYYNTTGNFQFEKNGEIRFGKR